MDVQQRQEVKRKILHYLKSSGVRGLVDDIRDGDLSHAYGDLTDRNCGNCWIAIYLGSAHGNGKGVFLQLYSRDETSQLDLRFSRYCSVHSMETQRIEFLQEFPIDDGAKTRDMGRIAHSEWAWENLDASQLDVLLGDCKLLLMTANEALGEFQGCVVR